MSQVKVLIVFYSRSGNTEALANAIAEGARDGGADVVLRRAREVVSPEIMAQAPGWKESADAMNARYEAPTADDADSADAIVFGSPTRFGNVSSELKAYIDSLGGLWFQGKLNDKVGAGFTSTASTHGGNESTILTMYNFMAHLGLVIVPSGFLDSRVFSVSTPYGASAVVPQGATGPSEDELAAAKSQGQRIAKIAAAVKTAQK